MSPPEPGPAGRSAWPPPPMPAPAPPPSPSWSPPAWPPPAPHGAPGDLLVPRETARRWTAVLAVVALLALVGALVVVPRLVASDGHPSAWDARLGGLPGEVERLRGLDFDHPVPVRFLDDAAFRRETAVERPDDAAGRRELRRLGESLRAVGLVSGPVDIAGAVDAEQQSSVLAFYDPDREEVVVRGRGPLDVAHRVTLAHELTHVLQDQHFDLDAMERRVDEMPAGSSLAFRGFVEGDATRVEDDYVEDLSDAERAEYDRSQQEVGERVTGETEDVPAVVSLLLSAPYRYGPPAVRVVAADGGNRRVDEAFRAGRFTEALFLEPNAVLDGRSEPSVAAPRLRRGERAVGDPDDFGAFSAYVLLASRLAPADALTAALDVGNGRSRTYRAGGRTCMATAVRATDDSAAGALLGAYRRWAATLPTGMVELRRRGTLVTTRSCDPGDGAALASPDAAVDRAATLLQLHDEIEAVLIGELADVPGGVAAARCASLGIVRSPQVAVLLERPESELTPDEVSDAISAAAPAVRQDCRL